MAKPSETTSNYSFTFKCLSALIAAGIVAAALYAKSTAVAGPVLASKAMLGTAAVASTPLSALALILIIGAICTLPFIYRPRGIGAYAYPHGRSGAYFPPTSSAYVEVPVSVSTFDQGRSFHNQHGHGGSSFFPPAPAIARTNHHSIRGASAPPVSQHDGAATTVHRR